MAYINGNSVRLTVLDKGTPVAVLYEQESTLNVNLNVVDLPHKDAMQWMVKQPFGLKDWSIDCTRFYDDDNDNAPLNFNDAVALLISGDQIQVEYNLGDDPTEPTIYEGFARVNSDTLNANQSEALIATVNLMGDGFLQKQIPSLYNGQLTIDQSSQGAAGTVTGFYSFIVGGVNPPNIGGIAIENIYYTPDDSIDGEFIRFNLSGNAQIPNHSGNINLNIDGVDIPLIEFDLGGAFVYILFPPINQSYIDAFLNNIGNTVSIIIT